MNNEDRIQCLEDENQRLRNALFYKSHPDLEECLQRRTEDRFSALKRDELLSAFAVGDDEPLLQAVIHVLHANEIECGDSAGGAGVSAEVAKGHAMAAAALKNAQEDLLEWVDEANKAKRNEDV